MPEPGFDKTAVFMGLVSSAAGGFVLLAAAGFIPAPEESFHAPHWVVGLCGLAFLIAGGLLLEGQLFAWLGRGGRRDEFRQTIFEVSRYWAGVSIITIFALIFDWIAFGPGERQFSSSISLPFFSVTTSGGQSIGRYMFGFGAIMLNLLAVWGWANGFRQLRRDLAGELERDETV
ncbi:MAG: hypothetical protein ACE5HA_06905 [Anaerolineae bacterium]